MATYTLKAIVLKRIDFGEADRLVTVLTKSKGKLIVLAQGIRKPRAKLVSLLEPFSVVLLTLAEGKQRDRIAGAELISSFSSLSQHLGKLGLASYFSESLDKLLVERQNVPGLFDLFVGVVKLLQSSKINPRLIKVFFELNLMKLLGSQPELYQSVESQRRLKTKENFLYSVQGGGLVSRDEESKYLRDKQPISKSAVRVLRLLAKGDFSVLGKLKPPKEILSEISVFSARFFENLFDRRLNSSIFLEELV